MSNKLNQSISLAKPDATSITSLQKIALAFGVIGLFIFILALCNIYLPQKVVALLLALLLIVIGAIIYARQSYLLKLEGVKNDGVWFKSVSSRGIVGWLIGVVLTGFYMVLYFYPEYLGLAKNDNTNTGLISLFDPLSQLISGRNASQWFVYGTLYTFAILVFGYKFLLKYRHNRYQKLRTISVMFFQLGFAFLIPEIMYVLNTDLPYYDLKSIWPLNYYNFESYRVNSFINNGSVGIALLIFGVLSIVLVTPILTYKYGKRWYCSWVCGCGGLAETAGDAFRQLSSKKISAWKFERWLIHLVLVFSIVMTAGVVSTYLKKGGFWTTVDNKKIFITYFLSNEIFIVALGTVLILIFSLVLFYRRKEFSKEVIIASSIALLIVISFLVGLYKFDVNQVKINASYFSFGLNDKIYNLSNALKSSYGFIIGAVFSGVVGTGFYPIFGSRVWCRFGCPMAAILGFQQRLFSKFRITTNGGQCISCGNCSTYCEMGIDVRAYAQKGKNILRSSCVGCGICAAVCPRGVLKLENHSIKNQSFI